LRPGEKLFEELITEGEDILPTYHEKIKIFQGPPVNRDAIERAVMELETSLARRDEAAVLVQLRKLVPEYQAGGTRDLEKQSPPASGLPRPGAVPPPPPRSPPRTPRRYPPPARDNPTFL